MPKLISIIVPVCNEEDNIQHLYDRVDALFKLINGYELELIFTDNRSVDKSFEVIKQIAANDTRVKAFRFSKNYGFQKSILEGYRQATGDAAIQLDCDLQDPPELIIEFLKQWEAGYAVVYGIRKRPEEFFLMNLTRKAFYRTLNAISESHIPLDAGDFRLIDRKVINYLKTIRDYQPYLRGIIAEVGFNQTGVVYSRNKRQHGVSKFNMSKLVKLGLDAVTQHSLLPLKLSKYFGYFLFTTSTLMSIYYMVGKLYFNEPWPSGFATLVILLLMLIGINSMLFGIIGEYVGRIYLQITKNPDVIIEESVN